MVASLRVVRLHIRRSPRDFDRPCRCSHAAFVFVLCHMSQSNRSISSSRPRCILDQMLMKKSLDFKHQYVKADGLNEMAFFRDDDKTHKNKSKSSHDLRDSLHGSDSILSPGHSEQPGGPQVQERERVRSPLHGSQHSPHSLHCVQHSINMIKNS